MPAHLREVGGDAAERKGVHHQRNAQPDQAVFPELPGALAVVRARGEITRDEEIQPQRKGLHHGGDKRQHDAGDIRLERVFKRPVALRAVGDGGVQRNHQHDQDRAQAVQIRHARGRLDRGRRPGL